MNISWSIVQVLQYNNYSSNICWSIVQVMKYNNHSRNICWIIVQELQYNNNSKTSAEEWYEYCKTTNTVETSAGVLCNYCNSTTTVATSAEVLCKYCNTTTTLATSAEVLCKYCNTTTTVATSIKHWISHSKMRCTLLLIKQTHLGETIILICVQTYSISPQEDCVWPDTVLRFPLKFWVSLNTRHYGDTKSFVMLCTLSQQRRHIKKVIYFLVPALQSCDLLNQLWIVHIKY